MNLFELLINETKEIRRSLLTYIFLSGLSNAVILFIINGAAATVTYQEINTRFLVMFVIAMSVYILTQQFIFQKTSAIIDQIIHKIRTRLTGKILKRAELVDLDNIGNSRIYNHMTQQTVEVSNSANEMTAAVQSLIMVVFAIMYLGTLSIYALIVTIVVIGIGMIVYLGMEKSIIPYIDKYNETEIKLFSILSHLLNGFKELKLSHERSNDLSEHLAKTSQEATDNSIQIKIMYANAYIFAQAFFYVLVGIMVFILPRFFELYTDSVTQITAVILFIIGPLSSVVAGIPAYTRSDIAINNIVKLENELDNLKVDPPGFDLVKHKILKDFKSIVFDDIVFNYYDRNKEKAFTVGPLNLTIRRGETIFIVGGNGSGKSTLLKLMTGLYRPESGTIRVDDVKIQPDNVQEYRELFSAIFADFHLFDRLYGIKNWDAEQVYKLIAQMQISDKTSFKDGEFSNINLSTGQRKRIAMIVTLLEKRNICIFDEWAADQDPQFREYYYYELLPQLKNEGKTLIIVSHDDSKFFSTADRILRMEDGKFIQNS
ncbi:MAG: cyclic peptide export ABC transporter [Balneolaceae bacterium]